MTSIKNIFPLDDLKLCLDKSNLKAAEEFYQAVVNKLDSANHGHLPEWIDVCEQVKPFAAADCGFLDYLQLGYTASKKDELKEILLKLSPWRKGPFSLGDVYVDTEWHSDWKWERVQSHLSDLKGRTILDVGCGSSYFGYRMLLDGAEAVYGIDPSWLFVCQSIVMREFAGRYPNFVLPLGIQELSESLTGFDTVFSMGVLYHRKDHMEHIQDLKRLLRDGGELVLETLVLNTEDDEVLIPEDRYAQMRNVWAVPSLSKLSQWVEEAGFSDVKIVDVNQTSLEEQRSTEWMTRLSLPDFLDKEDVNKTVEGHPAPVRAVLIAHK